MGRLAVGLVLAFATFVLLAGAAPSANVTRHVQAAYNLYSSYPNARRQRGYFLRGVNEYGSATTTSSPQRTSLWFQPQGPGAFKQFNTTPYRECHWDLLRWGTGQRGVLTYLATHAECYSEHTAIVFSPGIAYMPKTWTPGERWSDDGVSQTVYSENGVPVCSGTNTWHSRVVGLTRASNGKAAVHTQTNETQVLSAIAGAPQSASCPADEAARFGWQENFYVGGSLVLRQQDGSTTGSDVGLVRSTGGNLAAARAAGHPQWNSVFDSWDALPPAQAGTVTTTTTNVANASAGNTVTFTYTAPLGGVRDGSLTIAVPPGWTPPVTTDAVGCTAATVGTVMTSGGVISVSDLTLPANGQTVVTYGATSSGSCGDADGASASATPGAPVWPVAVVLSKDGPVTNLPTSPAIDVLAADGSGTLAIAPATVTPGSAGNRLTLTYTASAGGIDHGTMVVTVPPGWTAPVTGNASGCTTTTAGTLTTSGQTIVVSDLSLAANRSVAVTYGATSGGNCAAGDGVSAPALSGTSAFAAAAASTATGTTTPLAAAAVVGVG